MSENTRYECTITVATNSSTIDTSMVVASKEDADAIERTARDNIKSGTPITIASVSGDKEDAYIINPAHLAWMRIEKKPIEKKKRD